MGSADKISRVANRLEFFSFKDGYKWRLHCLLECVDLVCTNNLSGCLLKVILGIQKF